MHFALTSRSSVMSVTSGGMSAAALTLRLNCLELTWARSTLLLVALLRKGSLAVAVSPTRAQDPCVHSLSSV